MTFTGLMRRLAYTFSENHDLDIDTRRRNQFGCSEPRQTRVQHVLERNKRYIVRNFIPLSLISLYFSSSSVMICGRIGLSKSVPFIYNYKIFQATKLPSLMFQQSSKSTYELSPMGIALCKLGLQYYVK